MNLLQTKLYLKDTPGGTKLFMDDQKKTGEKYPVPVQRQELSRDLARLPLKDLDSIEVHYEKEMGKPVRIRRAGQSWQSQGSAQPIQAAQQGAPQQGAPSRPRQHFHNPYNFIPALPREAIAATDPLGDSKPKGHHRYHADHWSGRIVVKLTTATPLLIPDAALADYDNECHGTFPVRVDQDGTPYLPPTSIKGMLRSAYEAVTNSRLGVFQGHEELLAFRMEAHGGIEMIPAMIEGDSDDMRLHLLPGDSPISTNGAPEFIENSSALDRHGNPKKVALMYAAWLPRYKKYFSDSEYRSDKHESEYALRYPDDSLPQHGHKVWVKLNKKEHRSKRFFFYQVKKILKLEERKSCPPGYRVGIVCITGPNIMNKHDERVFLLDGTEKADSLKLPHSAKESWEKLISDYQQIHQQEIFERTDASAYLGHDPGKTGFSKHVFKSEYTHLKNNTLCYASIKQVDGSISVTGLYPVMISRSLYDKTPAELITDVDLLPAPSLDKLSPADRVFGWVNPDGNGAFRGQLRVGPVKCEQGAAAVVPFPEPGHPLPILGAPKPQQSRFYAARLENGEPLPLEERVAKHTSYAEGGGLRGRKVYPHHAHLARLPQYWDNPTEDRTSQEIEVNVNGKTQTYSQEYRRPDPKSHDIKLRDDQNRSLRGWVKDDTEFSFTLDIVNLSTVELGALLYLLRQHDGYFRLGSGKPFGFGSVKLKIVTLDIRDGTAWKAYYQNLISTTEQTGERITHQDEDRIEKMITDYKEAITRTYSKGRIFEEIPFIKGFIAMTKGFSNGLPVHYPRTALNPQPAGENFKWFVANEKDTREIRNRRKSLPKLETTAPGLPLWLDE